MSVNYNRRGNLPPDIWPLDAMKFVALQVEGKVVSRAFVKGLDVNDVPFRLYSTRRPVYISMRTRPTPTGGRLSRTGRSMRFASYRDYKKKTLQNTEVTLQQSGRLLQSYSIKRLSRLGFTMGPKGKPAVYGEGLQRQGRRWQGLSPSDREFLARTVADAVHRVLNGTLPRDGGGGGQ